jgi:hypothetical protein
MVAKSLSFFSLCNELTQSAVRSLKERPEQLSMWAFGSQGKLKVMGRKQPVHLEGKERL